MTRLPPDTRAALAPLRLTPLEAPWELARTPPGAVGSPGALAGFATTWHPARVPGTVAACLHADLDAPGDYDAHDWFYRTTFARPGAGTRHRLRFDGLATLAQAWLNGTEILVSRNMFRGASVDVTALLRDHNELVIAFRSLDAALAARRPRPRWKTRLVENQNLRWARTTLLGRMPGWSPPVAAVGPWAPIALESAEHVDVADFSLRAWAEGTTGRVQVEAAVEALAGTLQGARLRVGDSLHALAIEHGRVRGDLRIEDAPLWWPHTHGIAQRVACQLELEADGHLFVHDCVPIGFKSVALDTAGDSVRFVVNGVPVFCRGAVWTTADILALRAGPERLRPILEAVRDSGANMLRIGGTMAYESDDFYALCDELGILVWQDFMFANMDYPAGDAAFRAEVEAEAAHQLRRLAPHPCIAAYCGGSEIAQQAAMLGLAPSEWCNELFAEALPRAVARHHPDIPYFPSTPRGGALPMQVASGISHYYGVGAYRRPLADARGARVKFATECLGFSNVPADGTLAKLGGGDIPPPHHPRWKARVPRDNGSGYDFEDVRDHYLRELFALDPVALRAADPARYRAISRVVSGEVMQRTYSEWRAPASGCGGALVWFYRDLAPGAGFGLTDSDGIPKAAWWYLRRAWAPRALRITDEGLDGLALHVINESAEALDALVEIEMLQQGRASATRGEAAVRVAPRGGLTLPGDALFGHFTDSTNAYRFGPPKHDVAVARLVDRATGATLAEDFHFPAGLDLARQPAPRVEASAEWISESEVRVALSTDVFLQSVSAECEGFTPRDNHFHLAPGRAKTITFTAAGPVPPAFKAHFEALNATAGITVRSQRTGANAP
jgi:beta-mannosidase